MNFWRLGQVFHYSFSLGNIILSKRKMNEQNRNEEKDINQEINQNLFKESVNEIIEGRKDLTSFFEQSNHSINRVYFTQIPQICKDEPCQLGVDEAGRGPVLGPMVYGISYAPLSKKQLLIDLGCADSKSLTEQKRDQIFDDICKHKDSIGWAIDVISPTVIANSMYRRTKISLNEISMISAINLIKEAIEAGVNVTEVYVDTVGKPETYQTRLKNIFPGIEITVAKKADSTYPIVSAASICAKVSRDHAIRAWQFQEGNIRMEYGSGYPNDPVTKSWLSANMDEIFGFPQLVRFSWSTAEQILESKALPVAWEETKKIENSNEQKLFKFFIKSPTKSSNTHVKNHHFFTERCLSNATVL